MSIGYCGRIELFTEDESSAIYRYCGENWNDDSETRGDIHILDGEIFINKRCLVEPEIHTKIKKSPSHRKIQVTKRIVQEVNIGAALSRGDIEIIKPCTGEYSKGRRTGPDRMYFALVLLRKVFEQYQKDGKLPGKCNFVV